MSPFPSARRGPDTRRHNPLIGRETECARLDELIAALRAGQSRALVVRGAAGTGKSALLEYAESRATDMRVLRAAGVESEMELTFAALHQLCSPVLGRLGALPGPQRAAIETTFGLRKGTTPDRFLTGLAALSLLSDVAAECPLLCVIEDAQWLDRASAEVFGFIARRLLAGSVGLVFGTRQRGPELVRLPGLDLTGLASADARMLLDSVTHAGLDPRIRDRIAAETEGNPRALLEQSRGLTATRRAGGLGLLTAEARPGGLDPGLANRIRNLPEPAQVLLLVAAAEPVGDPDVVRRAAERLGSPLAAALADGASELLTIGERVIFRHPLVRPAVYHAAGEEDRRAAHLALAGATDEQADPDRRAWHLACAATGPDEAVAAELEQSADRAQERGGVTAAAAFLQRAVTLTADPSRRAGRMLAAAELSLQAGELDDARGLLAALPAEALDGFQCGRAGILRSEVAFPSGPGSAAIGSLLDAARLVSADPVLVRETYLKAWGMAVSAADQDALTAVSRAVRNLPPPGSTGPLDLLLDGLAQLATDGPAAAAATLEQAAKVLADLPAADLLRWGRVAAGPSAAIWDHDGMRAAGERQVQVVRKAGALRELPYHLLPLGYALSWAGDFEGAAAVIAESDAMTAVTGIPMPPYLALRLTSLQGRETETAELITATIQGSAAAGRGMALTAACWAGAVLYNGLGRYPEAMRAAQAPDRVSEPWLSTWQIGAQLFLSPRTVEWHLHKIFVKLSISSRRQLPDVL